MNARPLSGCFVKSIAKTMISPSVARYQRDLAETGAAVKAAGQPFDTTLLQDISGLAVTLATRIGALDKALAHPGADGLVKEATYFCRTVLPAMLAIRETSDTLEALVANDLWPLPTYQEMLFVK